MAEPGCCNCEDTIVGYSTPPCPVHELKDLGKRKPFIHDGMLPERDEHGEDERKYIVATNIARLMLAEDAIKYINPCKSVTHGQCGEIRKDIHLMLVHCQLEWEQMTR